MRAFRRRFHSPLQAPVTPFLSLRRDGHQPGAAPSAGCAHQGRRRDAVTGRDQTQHHAAAFACPARPGQGAGAISSDAYFGREQRADTGAGSSANLDMSASDLVSKIGITARQDMDSIKQASRAVRLPTSRAALGTCCSPRVHCCRQAELHALQPIFECATVATCQPVTGCRGALAADREASQRLRAARQRG